MQPWGRVLVPPARDTHNNIFELFCRYCKPPTRWEKYAAHKRLDPRPGGTRWSMMPTSTYLTTSHVEECPRADPPSLNHYYKTPHYPLQVGTHSLEGISPLWPPLPGKAIKLFYSTSLKTLSPRFNSVLGSRDQIRLQNCYTPASLPYFSPCQNKYHFLCV